MKATSLLEKQHRRVKALFKQLESGKGDAAALRVELANDLVAHMAIEQDIFYPAVHAVKEHLVLESFEEHALAELALKRLMATDVASPMFAARVIALKDLVLHHVKEEEGELFPRVRKVIGHDLLVAMGKQMKMAFEAAVAAGHRDILFAGEFAATTADAARQRAGEAKAAAVPSNAETKKKKAPAAPPASAPRARRKTKPAA